MNKVCLQHNLFVVTSLGFWESWWCWCKSCNGWLVDYLLYLKSWYGGLIGHCRMCLGRWTWILTRPKVLGAEAVTHRLAIHWNDDRWLEYSPFWGDCILFEHDMLISSPSVYVHHRIVHSVSFSPHSQLDLEFLLYASCINIRFLFWLVSVGICYNSLLTNSPSPDIWPSVFYDFP